MVHVGLSIFIYCNNSLCTWCRGTVGNVYVNVLMGMCVCVSLSADEYATQCQRRKQTALMERTKGKGSQREGNSRGVETYEALEGQKGCCV